MDTYSLLLYSLITFLLLVNVFLLLFRKGDDHTEAFKKLEADFTANQTRMENLVRTEFKNNREEFAFVNKNNQELLTQQLNAFGQQQNSLLNLFQSQLNTLTESNHKRSDELKDAMTKNLYRMQREVNMNLETIRKDNAMQLEKMRITVDEKLQNTLEKRLGKSFELVSQRLEAVQKGLGEMQTLANGVGDLKKVLANVKTRGILGEIQLGNILEQMLSPEQYGVNVATIPDSRCHVEFAIKFPGKDMDGKHVWLPIDSKFPMDKYQQVVDAYELGDTVLLADAQKDLLRTVKSMAKDIRTKYIAPPHTTDFAILFLPFEGLYAEIVRQPGLMEELQRDYKIMLAGPSNLGAFLNALIMGFRTLAIEKRSSEVWKILSSVKTEFGKFGTVLDKVKTKLNQASRTIDDVGTRSRAIERNLRKVGELPAPEGHNPLGDGLDMDDFSLDRTLKKGGDEAGQRDGFLF